MITIEFEEPKEIELLNDLIYQACEHGSDGHGWYNVNKDGLEESINDFLKFRKLDEGYEPVFYRDDFLGIVEKDFVNSFLRKLNIFDKDTVVALPFIQHWVLYHRLLDEEKKPLEERVLTRKGSFIYYKGIKIRKKKDD